MAEGGLACTPQRPGSEGFGARLPESGKHASSEWVWMPMMECGAQRDGDLSLQVNVPEAGHCQPGTGAC